MTGRSPARLLAPLALVATALALYAVVHSSGGSSTNDGGSQTGATPTASATKSGSKSKGTKTKVYVVKVGDTPSGIAAKEGVEVGALLDANPHADANNLHPGQKLKIP